MIQPEVHLFILWDFARAKEAEIITDIAESFTIMSVHEVHWSKKHFAKNMTRFYGTNLPKGSYKEEHVGTGPFLLVVVKDTAPRYETHETSAGPAEVNARLFLAKARHREWTGGGHRVHATNSVTETNHDLTLLLGLNAADYDASLKGRYSDRPTLLKKDLEGADGWPSLRQLFYVLNNTVEYVVMRNYEPLPDNFYMDSHGDIDLLCSDYAAMCYVVNSSPVFPEAFRVHHQVNIKGEPVLFDFRHAGDEYYSLLWQQNMLRDRVLADGFYVPNAKDHFYGLLYHALVHKPEVAVDYQQKLLQLAPQITPEPRIVANGAYDNPRALKTLRVFLRKQGYVVTKPVDHSVRFNQEHATALAYSSVSWPRRGARKARAYLKKIL